MKITVIYQPKTNKSLAKNQSMVIILRAAQKCHKTHNSEFNLEQKLSADELEIR